MADFPHLTLVQKITGLHQPPKTGGNRELDERTAANLANRLNHGGNLLNISERLKAARVDAMEERRGQGLPEMPGENSIPIFLQVDTGLFNIESLKGLGIEIISEEADGFIIGASADGFTSLRAKIEKFVNEEGRYKNQAAQLWQIITGTQWRTEQILSSELFDKWADLSDDQMLIVDVSIACYIAEFERTARNEGETDVHYNNRIRIWEEKTRSVQLAQSNLADSRQEAILEFLKIYKAEVNPEIVTFKDSFCFRVTLNGAALKDFVLNYPYVFEVVEAAEIESPISVDGEEVLPDLEILAPSEDAPRVCVIDSGIQEEHRLLSPAILTYESVNYDTYDATTTDLVANGGHGTRVAGAVLYGDQIPTVGQIKLGSFIYNARVLNSDNQMSSRLYPPSLMEDIVYNFDDAKLFNLSINSTVPCRTAHMSSWAAKIDQISHEEQVIFVVSAGNLKSETLRINNPGIKDHIAAGRNYPTYLLSASCRIADPAQSTFAITVGSVCQADFEDLDRISFGKRDEISSFSRTGPGMWGGIKPELVEYGGDWVREKAGTNLSYESSLNPLLVRSGGTGVDRSTIGTSFCAPKVTYILAQIQSALPQENALLHKALVIQSARLPGLSYITPNHDSIRMFGYGIPALNRAIDNSERRVTLVDSAELAPGNANLYTINIPDELRRQGEDFDVLVEVTLVFTAVPRRTRRRTQSYLSAWLSWDASKLDESFDHFKARILRAIDDPSLEHQDNLHPLPWSISSNPLWGKVKGVKRQDSATQKDWAIIKSNQLPDQLSFAVIGHKGWEKDVMQPVPFSIAVSLEALDGPLQVYERIRATNIIVEQQVNSDL